MPKYIIERDLPRVGKFSKKQLKDMAVNFCEVLDGIRSNLQWVHSYVTARKIYCVYYASGNDTIMERSSFGAFPVNKVSRVLATIDPSTAEP